MCMCYNGEIQGNSIQSDFPSTPDAVVMSLCSELATCFMCASHLELEVRAGQGRISHPHLCIS